MPCALHRPPSLCSAVLPVAEQSVAVRSQATPCIPKDVLILSTSRCIATHCSPTLRTAWQPNASHTFEQRRNACPSGASLCVPVQSVAMQAYALQACAYRRLYLTLHTPTRRSAPHTSASPCVATHPGADHTDGNPPLFIRASRCGARHSIAERSAAGQCWATHGPAQRSKPAHTEGSISADSNSSGGCGISSWFGLSGPRLLPHLH
jgi:hypothetical protein